METSQPLQRQDLRAFHKITRGQETRHAKRIVSARVENS